VGVPTSAHSISPTSAHTTPDAIRSALRRYSHTFAHAEDGTLLDLTQLTITDAGNLDAVDTELTAATSTLRELASSAGVVIALGGDNSATALVGQATLGHHLDTAGLITLDAHFDLREGHSNGSPVRELLEAGVSGSRIAQVGIADFANSAHYAGVANRAGITVIPRDALHGEGLGASAERALHVAGGAGGPLHVDIDMDVCDRSVAPACPASVPGGLGAWELRHLVSRLARDPRVVSFDITEIDATADTPDQRTIRLGALLVLDILRGLASRS
jgi:formiminoglutamase